MKPLYLHPLRTAKYVSNRTLTIEQFYEKHKTVKAPGPQEGRTVFIPSPITSEQDLEAVIRMIREAANG